MKTIWVSFTGESLAQAASVCWDKVISLFYYGALTSQYPTELTYPQLFALDTGIGAKEKESVMLDLTMWETVEKPQWCEASSFTPKAHGNDDDDSDDDAGVSLGAGHRAN